MTAVEELQQSGVLSEDDVTNIKEYHMNNRGNRQNKSYDTLCTKVDAMVSENIITPEQGQKLKEILEKNLNVEQQ